MLLGLQEPPVAARSPSLLALADTGVSGLAAHAGGGWALLMLCSGCGGVVVSDLGAA